MSLASFTAATANLPIRRSDQFSMGVLTEFLVATSDDAPLIKAALDRSSWCSVDAKGQSTETLAALWAILDTTMAEDEAERRFNGSLLTEDVADGPWVFELPSEFVRLVSAIDADSITEIHAVWCRHSELDVLDDEDASYVMEDLKELIRLSGEALAENRSLLMWMCL